MARVDEGQPQVKVKSRPRRGRDTNEALPVDPAEAPLERRAKRQGLVLMIASSIVSLLILYGAWRLLHL